MRPRGAALPALLALLALLARARPGAAANSEGLRRDAGRVAAALARGGARVEAPRAIFVERGAPRRLSLGVPRGGCATLALVAPRTAEFVVATGGRGGAVASASGVAFVRRCGASLEELGSLLVAMRSPRAAIEVLVASGGGPPPPLSDVLPERAPGSAPPAASPGPPLGPGPLDARVARAAAEAREDGAESVVVARGQAAESGAGALGLRLADGCHRLDVMAAGRSGFDLDAEAREAGTGRSLARDSAETPDARLEFCLGAPALVDLAFEGALRGAPLVVSVARWPLPPALPLAFGARARAGFAWAMRRRGAPGLPSPGPVQSAVGVEGRTVFPFEVEPGVCYVAALAVVRGDARALRLGARLGARARSDSGERPEAAALAFCAEDLSRGVFEVELLGAPGGAPPWWALALFPLSFRDR